jgi:uncharacterized protein YegP (UPF0339 family)
MFDWLWKLLFPDAGPIVLETFESKGKWFWRLTANNGEIVCDGSEGYSNRSNCRRAAKRVKRLMTIADVA